MIYWRLIAQFTLAVLVLGTLFVQPAGVGPSYTGSLLDAHSHLTMSISPPDLLSLFRKADLSGIVLFGDAATLLSLQKQNSDFVFPFAQPGGRDSHTGQLTATTLELIKQQFDTGVMRGVGELSLRAGANPNMPLNAIPADDPIALQIYDLAASRKVPVTVHVEFEYSAELERALDHNRNATIIWAHMGDGQPTLIREMLKKHANLYVDISARNPYMQRGRPIQDQSLTNTDGSLKSDWESVFEEFADRILYGTDIGGAGGQFLDVDQLVSYYRSVLGQLTTQTAEKIGYKNVQKFLGLAK
ncbi:amidohydrolase family protein [Candidatus Acetothermia bacterium]|nr:amidohydrolase family protein [Candidatus Acetothermia bacterium]